MKFLSATSVGLVVATVGLVAPVQAGVCTQDEAVKQTMTANLIIQSDKCNKVPVTGKAPTAEDICKVPGCTAEFKANLNKFPDCSINGENVRAKFASLSQCSNSSSSGASVRPTIIAGIAVLAAALAVVIA
ncbi:hypothetical protein ATCC90586_007171 [Pythium insidiosum]|nr:hypothetical protein ATCC90586_007171 [Pythium insidiosum]